MDTGNENYEAYVGSGEYNSRYKGVPARSDAAIKNAIIKAPAPATVLDFGCGEGRYFEHVIEDMPTPVNYIACDVTLEALKNLEKRLLEKGYRKEANARGESYDLADDKNHKVGYKGPVYVKGNKRVEFVRSIIGDEVAHTKTLLEPLKPNVTISMFGVISHIRGKSARQSTLRMLSDISHGTVILSVPNTKSHADTLKEFERKRTENSNPEAQSMHDLRDAKEGGDIYYTRIIDGAPVEFYYHLYSPDELAQDLKAANLKHVISCANIQAETDLTRTATNTQRIIDFIRSTEMRPGKLGDDALYLLAECVPEHKQDVDLHRMSEAGRGLAARIAKAGSQPLKR